MHGCGCMNRNMGNIVVPTSSKRITFIPQQLSTTQNLTNTEELGITGWFDLLLRTRVNVNSFSYDMYRRQYYRTLTSFLQHLHSFQSFCLLFCNLPWALLVAGSHLEISWRTNQKKRNIQRHMEFYCSYYCDKHHHQNQFEDERFYFSLLFIVYYSGKSEQELKSRIWREEQM